MNPMAGADAVILKSKVATPIECLHCALNLPTSVVITGIDKQEVLDQAFEAAKTFRPLDAQQFAEPVNKTRAAPDNTSYTRPRRISIPLLNTQTGWVGRRGCSKSWLRRIPDP